ncbi:MAG: hypothetical protein QOH23_1975 [Gaiellaceae bacterium]|nr:hypothetical protein [Gaiellaceae bacterium]
MRPDKLIAKTAFDALLKRKATLAADVVWVHHCGEGRRAAVRLDALTVQPRIAFLSRGDIDAIRPVRAAALAALQPHPDLAWIDEQRLADEDGVVTLDPRGGVTEQPMPIATDKPYVSAGAPQGLFLHELAKAFRPTTCLELGTAYGISTLYLLAGMEKGRVVTVEGDPVRRDSALRTFGRHRLASRVDSVAGWFPQVIPDALARIDGPLDMVFEDGPHTADVTLAAFLAVIDRVKPGGILVFDDIYHNAGNEPAWHEIASHPLIAASAELNARQGICVKINPSSRPTATTK